MRHHLFAHSDTYPVAILLKPMAFMNVKEIRDNYVYPLGAMGMTEKDVIAFDLAVNDQGKTPVSLIKEYLAELLPALGSIGTKFIYCTDGTYFKTLTGSPKAEPHLGYSLPCKIKGFEDLKVIYGINYQQLIYDPRVAERLTLSLQTLYNAFKEEVKVLGAGIIEYAFYADSDEEVQDALNQLHQFPELACDIEAFNLDFDKAGIGTISFAWTEHRGCAFAVDYAQLPFQNAEGHYGEFHPNLKRRAMLKKFLQEYKGRLIFHRANYDVKVMIFVLWMKDLLDREGMTEGVLHLSKHMDDTKVIAYLATNSCAGNTLGLKYLAHGFAGNWAVEVSDIRRVELKDLLRYNLIDSLSTVWVKKKYWPIMVADDQLNIYQTLMMPTVKLLLSVELIGMPLSKPKVAEARRELEKICKSRIDRVMQSPLVAQLNGLIQQAEMEKANAKLKVKQHPLSHFSHIVFNPNSGPQLQRLFYEVMGMPHIDFTESGLPATGGDTIEKLVNHTTNQEYKEVLTALMDYSKANKVLTAFIPAFEAALDKGDHASIIWLHGSFNVGGTVSGRLSSSDPNLQQIPAGNANDQLKAYIGLLIKECFQAPPGWIFAGADFNSLEDYISALLSKDPNKLNVYIRGFDGHCLRAAYYYRDVLKMIDLDDPNSVNSIKKTHPELRQESKIPTFALTYQGTWRTLVHNLGWEAEKAKKIEASYHELYKVSDQYIHQRLVQASKDGYVTVAFGLRVRTPMLHKVIFGAPKMPSEAAAEGRTAGNAMGQSYGLLNNRAAIDFMEKVWASEYRNDIFVNALIHDAIYLIIRDDVEVVEWTNRELVKSMCWQDLPEIDHPTVRIGAALDLFWPSWKDKITLPVDASAETIKQMCEDAIKKAKEKSLETCP